MDKIQYINNGQTYRPETIKLGSGPDGGLTIYCYNDMPVPPVETELVMDESGEYITEKDRFAPYNRVRYMQCAVRLSVEESNEVLLTLMTMTDKRLLSLLKEQIRELEPEQANALEKALTDSLQYLFPDSGFRDKVTDKTIAVSNDPVKRLEGDELNQYLDILNLKRQFTGKNNQ